MNYSKPKHASMCTPVSIFCMTNDVYLLFFDFFGVFMHTIAQYINQSFITPEGSKIKTHIKYTVKVTKTVQAFSLILQV